jgi:hypothetical protein
MPRPRKTPIAELPAITAADRAAETAKVTVQADELNAKRAPNARNFKEAYQTTGVPIETVKIEHFGPGADYPSNTVSTRYFDPSSGRTFQLSWSDSTIDAIEAFCDMMEENGYLPCQSPDAPKPTQRQAERAMPEVRDALDEDKAIGRRARQTSFTDDDPADVELTFGQFAGKTLGQLMKTKRGVQYVEWLSNEARDRAIRNAARALLD